MDKRLLGYRRVQLNSLTVVVYNALNLTSLTRPTVIITSPRLALKVSAAAVADNLGWLGGAPSVFQRRRMIPAGGGGAVQRSTCPHFTGKNIFKNVICNDWLNA